MVEFLTQAFLVKIVKESETITRHGVYRHIFHEKTNKDMGVVAAIKGNRLVSVYYEPRCTCGQHHED